MDIDGLYKELGERLVGFRRQAQLTQEQVAKRVGLTRTSITNIERGRQRIMLHQLFLLASAVGVSPTQLLYDHDTPLEDLVPAQNLARIRASHSDEELLVLKQTLNSAALQRSAPREATAS